MTNDDFRVRIVDIHNFVNVAVEKVWLWFKISRSLSRLLRLDQVEVRVEDYVPRLDRHIRIKPVPHELDKVVVMFIAYPEPERRRFVFRKMSRGCDARLPEMLLR